MARKIYGVEVVGDQTVTGNSQVEGKATVGDDLDVNGFINNRQLPTNRMQINANHIAQAGQSLHFNTVGGTFTVTLPADPEDGACVGFVDVGGACEINVLKITPGAAGRKIMGLEEDLNINRNYRYFWLEYIAETNDWRIK